jgi:4-hydroxyphenylpyruvate dioxygenase
VTDAAQAFEACVAHGGQPVLPPTTLHSPSPSPSPNGHPQDQDQGHGQEGQGHAVVAEVRAYGDVVLRFVSRHKGFDGAFLPGYRPVSPPPGVAPLDYGLERLDHAVGNVWDLLGAVNYVGRMTGFHEFAEFTAEDVGTTDSGLNSIVLASNDERVLLPLNEPTYGTPRKSQIQTYLEQNMGPGLQHLALATPDIFATMRRMRAATAMGGFEFQDPPNRAYYEALPGRIGAALTPEQYRMVEELGLLVDRDDQGVLLQVRGGAGGVRGGGFCVRVYIEKGGDSGGWHAYVDVCVCVCVF